MRMAVTARRLTDFTRSENGGEKKFDGGTSVCGSGTLW
jgi:hypothetical protein